ncbi:MAG: hypothetical protein ACOYZ7_19420 [Chloroflexota bacterium]
MSIEFPDIMGDYLDARQRFDAGGLHYICTVEPASLAPGGQTDLLFLTQSALDVPVEASLQVEFPSRTSRLGGQSLSFKMAQPEMGIHIAPGEVGVLRVPITCAADTPEKEYDLKITFKATPQGQGQAIRASSNPGRLGKSLIRDPVGLGIAPVIGVGYVARPALHQTLKVQVVGPPSDVKVDLSPSFETLWTMDELSVQQAAQREVSDRRIHIKPKLAPDALFAALWHESQKLFEDAGLPLRMGEAIFLARILTYTAWTFLSHGDWYDALLVPMWMAAMRNDLPTGDALWVVTQVGYEHLLRLSTAVSFGLLDRTMGRELWSNVEQQGVMDLLVRSVCHGQDRLLPEFVYLPLILGGLAVAREVKMPEEDLDHSLQLLVQAYHDRADVFTGEVAVVNDLFEQLAIAARR